MSYSWKELKALSDKQLVEGHDWQAQRTATNVNYYLEELRHRDQRRIAESQQRIAESQQQMAEEVLRLTKQIACLTKVILVLTAFNVAVAIILALR